MPRETYGMIHAMPQLPRDPRRLPSMPVAQRESFPKTKGLYFAIANDEIVYAGMTADSFRDRWCDFGGHKQYAKALKENARIYFWELTCSDDEIDDLETEAIHRWWPRWNKSKKPKHLKPKGNPAKLPRRVPWSVVAALALITVLLLS